MASNIVENTANAASSATSTEKLSTCDVVSASERASDFKKDFICSNDALHEQMLNSPWPVIMYAFSVLFVMYLVKRTSDGPHRAVAAREKAASDNKGEGR